MFAGGLWNRRLCLQEHPEAGRDPLPNSAVYEIKAAPLARPPPGLALGNVPGDVPPGGRNVPAALRAWECEQC